MFKKNIIPSLPSYWNANGGSYQGLFTLSPFHSEEYSKVEELFYECTDSSFTNPIIESIKRVQNVQLYGKFLLRKQQFATFNFPTYMRRMLLVLPKDRLHAALFYNLDARMTGIDVLLQKSVNRRISKESVVLVVNVLYCNEEDLSLGQHDTGLSSENYIEYIITFR